MKKVFLFIVTVICFVGCTKKVDEGALANERVAVARHLVDSGKWNQAKIELDSVHLLYPKQVAVRRVAKALSDSIGCLEAQRNLAYADSVVIVLSQRADQLKKHFSYSRNEKYEDKGCYIHRDLYHAGSPFTCIQASVDDDAQTQVRSYYAGKKLNHRVVSIKADAVEQSADGNLYVIGDGAERCEITTIDNDGALTLLNFISSHSQSQIRVFVAGESEASYLLSKATINALNETYELAIVMRDLRSARHQIKVSKAIIEKNTK